MAGSKADGTLKGRLVTLPAVGTADLREAPAKLLQASAEAIVLGQGAELLKD